MLSDEGKKERRREQEEEITSATWYRLIACSVSRTNYLQFIVYPLIIITLTI
jgi:hypothetical protein